MNPSSPISLRVGLLVTLAIAFAGVIALLSGTVESRALCVVTGSAWILLAVIYPIVTITNGYSPTQSGIDYRDESPFAFWAGLATYTFLLGVLALGAVVYSVEKYRALST